MAGVRFNVDINTTLALAAMDSSESSESTRYSEDFNDAPASLLERMEARQQLQVGDHHYNQLA
jgi:hypothetical protein